MGLLTLPIRSFNHFSIGSTHRYSLLVRDSLRLEGQDRGGHDLHESKRTVDLLDNLPWIVGLLDFTPLFNQLDLFLPQHLGATLVELISLLKVMFGLFWSELIKDILDAGFFRNDLDREGLLHFEHVFHEALVSVFTVERVAPCASQVIYCDIWAHVSEFAPKEFD